MGIASLLEPGCVSCTITAATKKELLHKLARAAAPYLKIDDRQAYESLLQRERLGTTGLGHGIAIPHARLEGVKTIKGFFAHLPQPINYDAVDKQPVDLVFALFAPADSGADHLNALVEVSRLLRNTSLTQRLRETHDADLLYSVLTTPAQQYAA